MTDRILIRRSEVNPPYVPREPLTWAPDGEHRRSGAWVVCANGHAGLLDHEIDAAGVVTPSILCCTPMGPDAEPDSNYYSPTARECGWHEFATLEGWGG